MGKANFQQYQWLSQSSHILDQLPEDVVVTFCHDAKGKPSLFIGDSDYAKEKIYPLSQKLQEAVGTEHADKIQQVGWNNSPAKLPGMLIPLDDSALIHAIHTNYTIPLNAEQQRQASAAQPSPVAHASSVIVSSPAMTRESAQAIVQNSGIWGTGHYNHEGRKVQVRQIHTQLWNEEQIAQVEKALNVLGMQSQRVESTSLYNGILPEGQKGTALRVQGSDCEKLEQIATVRPLAEAKQAFKEHLAAIGGFASAASARSGQSHAGHRM